MRWPFTLMPARRTASSLPPIAPTALPGIVRLRKNQARTKKPIMMSGAMGMAPMNPPPSRERKRGSTGDCGVSEKT